MRPGRLSGPAERVDGWPRVDPLESVAGAHPIDDVVVRLDGPVQVERGGRDTPRLRIEREPAQITGRFYALVTFDGPAGDGDDRYRVRHYRRGWRLRRAGGDRAPAAGAP